MPFLLWIMLAINFSMVAGEVKRSPPVLIWGIEAPKTKTIFRPVSTNQFAKLMKNILKDHMLVVYFASELNARDINCATCFPYMRFIQPMTYYSQVEEPLQALQRVSEKTSEITWHRPDIRDIRGLELEMALPCEKGRIHSFSFDDRRLEAQDNAIAVSYYQFSECQVVHVYTAFTEESNAYKRRKFKVSNMRRKPQSQNLQKKPGSQSYQLRAKPNQTKPNEMGKPNQNQTFLDTNNTTNEGMPIQMSFSESSNLTILRHESAVFAFRNIMLATRESKGTLARFSRSTVNLVPGNHSMQLGLYNDLDAKAGMVLVLDTDTCPLVIELLPVKGNWHLTRVFCGNRSLYPRDLIVFASEFSLCCQDVTFYSADQTRLSVFSFHLDIITSEDENGLDEEYEPKPCWSCSQIMSATLTQSLVVMLFFLLVLWIGLSFITSIGRNTFVEVAGEPDLHIKADL